MLSHELLKERDNIFPILLTFSHLTAQEPREAEKEEVFKVFLNLEHHIQILKLIKKKKKIKRILLMCCERTIAVQRNNDKRYSL